MVLPSLCLLVAAGLGGENPTTEPPLASAAAPLAAAWIAAAVAILAALGAAALLRQVVRQASPPAVAPPDPALPALGRKLERLQAEVDKLQREVAGWRAAAAPGPALPPEPEPEPAAEPQPTPVHEAAPAAASSPHGMFDTLLEQTPETPEGRRLQGFLAALLTVPSEIHQAFRGSPAEAAERIESRREALDEALYQRWPAAALEQACEGAVGLESFDWESAANGIRKRQEQAIEELAGHGLRRFAPPPMALLSPDTAVPSDEPPVLTHNPDLRDRIAGVTPGNGGWRIGQDVVCRARARLYEYRPEAEA